MLFWKALCAFLVLPGIVAFAVPLLLLKPADTAPWWPGAIIIAVGAALLLRCVREFYVAGRGTLAPWSPPKSLVITGPYRWSRNPMYVGVLLVLLGWAACFQSRALLLYGLAVAIAFHVRVVVAEEPWQARTFGEDWTRYKAHTPRWAGMHGNRR
jgi:protein-S-isoprenylcysteine O-methyltransferase Ste14